jgi:hypothetical protein
MESAEDKVALAEGERVKFYSESRTIKKRTTTHIDEVVEGGDDRAGITLEQVKQLRYSHSRVKSPFALRPNRRTFG